MFRAQAVKKLAHSFLNISCSGDRVVGYFFYLVNLKLVSRPIYGFQIVKSLSSETTEYGQN